MTINHPRLRRLARDLARAGTVVATAMVLTTAWAGAESGDPPADASAVALATADAAIVTPAGLPLDGGEADTPFAIELPPGAACTGDTANDGYFVYGYLIAGATDPTSLAFDADGPVPTTFGEPQEDYQSPLYETTGTPLSQLTTAPRSQAGDPGVIVNLPTLDLMTVVSPDLLLPSGTYNLGIACWQVVTASNPTAHIDGIWNAVIEVDSDAGPPAAATWEVVDVTPTATLLAVEPATEADEGDDVSLTATVTPADAPGAVTFRRDGVAIGDPVVVASGSAALTVSDLAPGAFELTARFEPDDPSAYAGSMSVPTDYTVNPLGPIATTTGLTADPADAAVEGEMVTLTATITPSDAVGTVEFYDGTTLIGSAVTVTGGSASTTTADLALGAHTLAAQFMPSDSLEYTTSGSGPVDYVINDETTEPPDPDVGIARVVTPEGVQLDEGTTDTPFMLQLPVGAACTGDTADDGYYVYGYMVAAGISPTSLTFDADGPTPAQFGEPQATFRQPLYDVTGDPLNQHPTAQADAGHPGTIVQLPSLHLATLVVPDPNIPSGDYNVGVACWHAATSENPTAKLDKVWNIVMTVVAGAGPPPSVSWSVEQALGTVTTLTVAPESPADFGDDITLTAVVAPTGAPGTVTFLRDGVAINVVPVAVDGSGTAVLTTNEMDGGTFNLSARFTPTDPDAFAGSDSETVPYEITLAATTTTLAVTPTDGAGVGEEVTLTATVAPTEAAGTVTFLDGATPVGEPVTVTSGSAVLATSALTEGDHTLTARFDRAEGAGFASSTSNAVEYAISGDAVTTTITLEVEPTGEVEVGEDVVLTATVSPAEAAGEVTFEDDGDELDGEADLSAAFSAALAVAVTDGTATLTVSDLDVGDHSFTARFDPDDPDAFAVSTSAAISLEVVDPSATSSTTTSSTSTTVGGSSTSTTTAGGGSGSLARTGSPVPGMLVWAALAIALGRIAVLLGRRVETRSTIAVP